MNNRSLDFKAVGIEGNILRDGENWGFEELFRSNDFHLRPINRANSGAEWVFKMSGASSQPRRAIRTPY